jgi:hypothetical protein
MRPLDKDQCCRLAGGLIGSPWTPGCRPNWWRLLRKNVSRETSQRYLSSAGEKVSRETSDRSGFMRASAVGKRDSAKQPHALKNIF